MRTIHLKIDEKIYDQFLWLLSKFNKEEVEIISDLNDFTATQSFLQKELDEITNGSAKLLTQVEFENRLDQVI